jgi:DNA-binding transcriptional regulator YiaG
LEAVDWDRGVLKVTLGKGGRDRVVPVSLRAMHWLKRYRDQGRPQFDPGACAKLFVNSAGLGFSSNGLGNLVRDYLVAAGHRAAGSCHVFRHAMATAMLDHGADIRFVQEMLGHQRLETTRIYTHVSIEKLKAVHRTTHPSEIGWMGQAVAGSFQRTVSPGDVVALRRSLDLDQPSFARVLNMPTKSLTNLEAGRTSLSGAVLRLLQILSSDPNIARKIRDSVPEKAFLD